MVCFGMLYIYLDFVARIIPDIVSLIFIIVIYLPYPWIFNKFSIKRNSDFIYINIGFFVIGCIFMGILYYTGIVYL